MARQLSNWLESYLIYASGQESPERFHFWCAVSSVAAAIERYCWLDRGYYTLYPNLYVVLCSESALHRKTTAINLAAEVVRTACPDINFICQGVTPAALLKDMSEIYQERGVSSAYIVNDELGKFLGDAKVSGPMVGLLTQLYGSPKVYDAHTIARGKELCNDVCVNVISGTTPEWIHASLTPQAISGGFAGRLLFIFYTGPVRLIGHPVKSQESKEVEEKLINDLREIRLLRGPFKETEEAGKWFDIWYEETYKIFTETADPLMKGYFGRKADTLLKLAMVLRAAQDDSMILQTVDMEEALGLINKNEEFLPGILERIESTEVGREHTKILNLIRRRKKISFKEIVAQYSYCMSARVVQERLETLVLSDMVFRGINQYGTWFYDTALRMSKDIEKKMIEIKEEDKK